MKKEEKAGPESVPPDVLWHLQRADGFMDLGMWKHARQEMEHVPDPYRKSGPWLEAQFRLAAEAGNWPEAAALAVQLKNRNPDEAAFWVQLAYAVRRAESIEAARAILSECLEKFPKVAVIPFNLACYECRLGNNEQAMAWLKRAFEIDPTCQRMALEDEDLRPLWDQLES